MRTALVHSHGIQSERPVGETLEHHIYPPQKEHIVPVLVLLHKSHKDVNYLFNTE